VLKVCKISPQFQLLIYCNGLIIRICLRCHHKPCTYTWDTTSLLLPSVENLADISIPQVLTNEQKRSINRWKIQFIDLLAHLVEPEVLKYWPKIPFWSSTSNVLAAHLVTIYYVKLKGINLKLFYIFGRLSFAWSRKVNFVICVRIFNVSQIV